MGYKIGSFNLRKLSFSTKDEDEGNDGKSVRRAYGDIGTIIRDNFDVVAMQEVLTDNVMPYIFPANFSWDYRWIRTRSKNDDSGEGYAFAWNTARLKPVTEPALWVQYRQDKDLGSAGLLRHPYYGRFTPVGTISGGPFCEFRLINTHIRFNPKENALLPLSGGELRQREFKILTEQILNRLGDKRYGDYMPAYTILLGDYNLNLNCGFPAPYVEDVVLIVDAKREKKLVTVQKKPTTISKDNPGYVSNYDHFTYDEFYFNNQGIRVSNDTIDTVSIYRNGDFERHWREISDHIPIILEVNLR